MDQQKIGKFIALRRKDKKITQEGLAEKLGVSNRTISNWENGKYLPDYNVLIPLCKELDISIVELLDGEKKQIEIKENRYLQQVEKVINFVSVKQTIEIQQCRKIGKILFFGGILLYLFSLFILTNREPSYYIIFIPISLVLIILGISYINKTKSSKKRMVISILTILIFIFSFSAYDFINMIIFNKPPKFYYSCSYNVFGSGSEYCQTLLFDSYRCVTNDDKYHITYKGYIDRVGNGTENFNFCD